MCPAMWILQYNTVPHY